MAWMGDVRCRSMLVPAIASWHLWLALLMLAAQPSLSRWLNPFRFMPTIRLRWWGCRWPI
jgi:hypothetical protein